MTSEQLAFQPSSERWPLWATVGHLACQRVSALCGLAGEPGAETTPIPNALYECPGDEDLKNILSAADLVAALDSTFRIVEQVLDSWTFEMLHEELHRTFGGEDWRSTRSAVIQRAFAHDIAHVVEVSDILRLQGLPPIAVWE